MVKIVWFLLLIGIYPVPTMDEYWAAKAIEGEGINLCADPELAARYILDTVANRLDAGWCSSIQDCVMKGYWGHTRVIYPQEKNILLARRILGRPYRPRIDAVYAFSRGDIHSLNLNAQDASAFVGGVDPFFFYPKETTFAREGDKSIETTGAGKTD